MSGLPIVPPSDHGETRGPVSINALTDRLETLLVDTGRLRSQAEGMLMVFIGPQPAAPNVKEAEPAPEGAFDRMEQLLMRVQGNINMVEDQLNQIDGRLR